MSYVNTSNTPAPCGCHERPRGLGAFSFESAGIGAGTIAAIAAVVLILLLWKGKPAQTRRRKLVEAREAYQRRVAEIKRKYGRFTVRGED